MTLQMNNRGDGAQEDWSVRKVQWACQCVLPGSRQSADSGKKQRRLHIDMDTQRQLPVVALHFACTPRVLEFQHCLQAL